MKIPSKLLLGMKQECSEFAREEGGTGIADYGAVFAVLMLLAGAGAGWFMMSNQPAPVANVSPRLHESVSAAKEQPTCELPAPRRLRHTPCEACGMG